MAKILKHFYIEKEQAKYLERESKRTGKSQAKIVRELINFDRSLENSPSKEGLEWAKRKIEEKYGKDDS